MKNGDIRWKIHDRRYKREGRGKKKEERRGEKDGSRKKMVERGQRNKNRRNASVRTYLRAKL